MESLYSANISTAFGQKKIEVYCCDVTLFDEPIDILTTSAFANSYAPTPNTIFRALDRVGISVGLLALRPFIDLRHSCGTWLSEQTRSKKSGIGRIGCIEMRGRNIKGDAQNATEEALISSICAYFHMLDIAAVCGVKMETVALPLLGTGSQKIASSLMVIPLLNECVSFLKRNAAVKRLCFIERNQEKANLISESIQKSHTIASLAGDASLNNDSKPKAVAFISYSSKDKNIADNLCFKLEKHGVAVWYAPRDVHGPYASAIAQAIDRSTHFIVILSENSMTSEHVLNEIDLAFQGLPSKLKFKPLRVDTALFTPSFKYYLSRQHWMDATIPPLEKRLNEFVEEFMLDL